MLKELVAQYKPAKPDFYLSIYEQLWKTCREDILSVLEIGIASGNSLRVWADFFPNATIYGIDLNIPPGDFGERIKMFQGDQSDKAFLCQVIQEVGSFDIIIDDGSHRPFDWRNSWIGLYPALEPGGYYVIEDLMAPLHAGWDPKEKDYIEPWLTDLCSPLLSQVRGSNGLEWITLRPHLFIAKKWKG